MIQQVSIAQFNRENRLSIQSFDEPRIQAVKDSILCLALVGKSNKKEERVLVDILDKNIKSLAKQSFKIGEREELSSISIIGDRVGINLINNKKGSVRHILWNYIDGSNSAKTWKISKKTDYLKVYSSDEVVVAKGIDKSDQEYIEYAYLDREQLSFIRFKIEAGFRISKFEYSHDVNQFFLVLSSGPAFNYQVKVLQLNNRFQVLNEAVIQSDDGKFIFHSPKIEVLSDSKFYVSGLYTVQNEMKYNGFYLGLYENKSWQFVKLYDFDKFDSFYKISSELNFTKMKRQREKKMSKGKGFETSVDMIFHPILISDSLIFISGDVYFETYTTEYYIDQSFGQPVRRTRQVFDGYAYSNQVTCVVQLDGTKVKDDVYEINKKVFQKEEQTYLVDVNDQIYLLIYGNRFMKMTPFRTSFENDETQKFELFEENNEETKGNQYSVIPWHQNQLLEFGYRKVKSKGSFLSEVFYEVNLLIKE